MHRPASSGWKRFGPAASLCLCVCLCLSGAQLARARTPRVTASVARVQSPVDSVLRALGLDDKEIAAAANGTAVAKLLPSPLDRDVVVLGAVAIRSTPAAYLTHALEPGRLLGEGKQRVGLFADPATDADVQDAAFDASEYRDLRKCRPGDCNFKLPASEMAHFVDGVDWSLPGAKGQADAMLRRYLVRLIGDYRARGNDALPSYTENGGVRAADAFATLLAEPDPLYDYAPGLKQYLAEFPANRSADMRDIFYWSIEHQPHLRPTLAVNHLVAYTPATGAAVVARKQLYATHYFEAALEVLAVVPGADTTTSYLVTVRRFRFDNLPRGLFNIRGRVRRELANAARADLARERAEAESAAR
jgi:hypothetical protein